MIDFQSNRNGGDGGDGEEPRRDLRLAAALRDALGELPMNQVQWDALAGRIGAAVRAQQATPWWGYVERWRRRAVPIALAAGIAGALVLVQSAASRAEAPLTGAIDMVSAVVAGTPSDEAATTYTRGVTNTVYFTTEFFE